ncbi:MAG: hypothetical protein QOF73_2799 [Thermomicrobiales bacterium]|nr:hypothetical protein [Thermomicrobiales bacterium]
MDVETTGQGTGSEETVAGLAAEELAAVRELILRAHPDVVPELVTGRTVGELTASVEAARAAYAGVVSRQPSAVSTPPVVPAGGATVVVDPANLPTAEKIRRGLAARTK